MKNDKIKQYIIINTGTNPKMRKGKMIAQGCHAEQYLLDKYWYGLTYYHKNFMWNDWKDNYFTKIVCQVDNELDLYELYLKARWNNIPAVYVCDYGFTEFNNIPTLTAIALGPYYSNELNKLTKDLKLL